MSSATTRAAAALQGEVTLGVSAFTIVLSVLAKAQPFRLGVAAHCGWCDPVLRLPDHSSKVTPGACLPMSLSLIFRPQ